MYTNHAQIMACMACAHTNHAQIIARVAYAHTDLSFIPGRSHHLHQKAEGNRRRAAVANDLLSPANQLPAKEEQNKSNAHVSNAQRATHVRAIAHQPHAHTRARTRARAHAHAHRAGK